MGGVIQQERTMDKLIGIVSGIFMAIIGISILYLLFALVPVSLYTEAECLRQGYPKSSVSIGLERYCMTLDGSVTVRVDHK